MSNRANFILKLLNIRKGETLPIVLMMIYSFFLGLSIAFFLTVATSLLLTNFESSILPYSYIMMGIIGYLLWLIYSKFETRIKYSHLLIAGVSFLFVSIFVLILAHFITGNRWVSFIMYSWMRVFLFIGMIGFWGLAQRLFNLRQAKRLFGLISSGEVISNLIGFFSIPFILNFIATDYLLYFSLGGLAVCIVVMFIIVSIYHSKLSMKLDNAVPNEQVDQHVNDSAPRPRKRGIMVFLQNKYYLLLFLLAAFPMLGMIFIDYIFLAQTRIEYTDTRVLTGFLGIFFGILAVAEFIVKSFLSGRLISKYGLRFGLISLPIILGAITFFSSSAGLAFGAASIYFSFVALNKLMDRVLRSSLFDPSYQILLQPLDERERPVLQSKIEGVPKAFGNILAGVILLVFTSLTFLSPIYLNILFFMIVAVWIKLTYDMHSEYRKSLDNVLSHKIETETADNPKEEFIRNLTEMIDDLNFESIEKTYQLLWNTHRDLIPRFLTLLLGNDDSKHIKFAVARIVENSMIGERMILNFYHENAPDSSSKQAVELGLAELNKLAELKYDDLERLSKSEIGAERLLAANLLGYSKRYNAQQLLMALIHDDDCEIRSAALISSGKIGRSELWQPLIDSLSNIDTRNTASSAIQIIGQPILGELESKLKRMSTSAIERRRIILLIEMIGGKRANSILRHYIQKPDRQIQKQIFNSLSTIRYQARSTEKSKIKNEISRIIHDVVWLNAAIIDIRKIDDKHRLIDRINREIEHRREAIFRLLSLLYDAKNIKLVRDNITYGDKDAQIFALEIIDVTLSEELKEMVLPIFDEHSSEEFIAAYRDLFPQLSMSPFDRLIELINASTDQIEPNTKACAIEYLEKFPNKRTVQALSANINHPDQVVAETAIRILHKLDSRRINDIAKLLYTDERNRLLDLLRYIECIERHECISVTKKIEMLESCGFLRTMGSNSLTRLLPDMKFISTIEESSQLDNDESILVVIDSTVLRTQGNMVSEESIYPFVHKMPLPDHPTVKPSHSESDTQDVNSTLFLDSQKLSPSTLPYDSSILIAIPMQETFDILYANFDSILSIISPINIKESNYENEDKI